MDKINQEKGKIKKNSKQTNNKYTKGACEIHYSFPHVFLFNTTM